MTDPNLDILYVITDLKLGGVPLHLLRLAKAMQGRGLRAAVVALGDKEPVGAMLAAEGVEVFGLETSSRFDFRVIGRLASVITRTNPRIIHAMLFHANLASRLAASSAGFPCDRVICEIQTVEVERRWHLMLDRWTHRFSRLTIGNSPSVIEHLAVVGRIPRSHLTLVRGGIDPTRMQDAKPVDRESLGVPVDMPLVLWVGRLDPVKGLDVLFKAIGLPAAGEFTHLLVVGGGAEEAKLRRVAAAEGLEARVHFLGPRDDIPALLAACDVFALPSRTEGLPNALLEAMASGCPIVTTDVPGCRDLITHERTGLVVPYGDVSGLAQAIGRLVSERELAEQLGRAAIEEVSDKWHINKTYDAYADLYASIERDRER